MLIVQKFGGSSLADLDRIMNVARRIVEKYNEGNSMVVVLSAQGDTTDELIKKAQNITHKSSKREMDMLISTGEQQCIALTAMAIHSLGVSAVSLNASQAGIYSSNDYGNARIKHIETSRITSELEKNNIVIVAGFQGMNKYGDILTLGRGGSDTTAVALAASLGADLCEIYTDVDGIYTADPRFIKDAYKLEEINYDEMLELASLGAKVLHNRSVELAKKYSVRLVVRSSFTNERGTIVKEECTVEKMLVSGLAVDKDVSHIVVVGLKDTPGIAFKLFSLLAKKNIVVDIIMQGIGINNLKDISFTVSRADEKDAIETLKNNRDFLRYESIISGGNVVKLSAVGAGMASNPGVAASLFEALYDVGVNIKMISTSEIKISVLIDESDLEIATTSAHNKLMLRNMGADIENGKMP